MQCSVGGSRDSLNNNLVRSVSKKDHAICCFSSSVEWAGRVSLAPTIFARGCQPAEIA
jgi:hypothetical protein